MPQPGWYADPDGTPGRLRWWDGLRWSVHTRPAPRVVPDAPGPPRRPSPGGGSWRWLAISLVATMVVAVVWGLFGFGAGRTTATPTPAQRSSPVWRPSPFPSFPSVSPSRPRPSPSVPRSPSPTASPLPTAAPDTGGADIDFPAGDLGNPCPGAMPVSGALSDGRLAVTVPDEWSAVAQPVWLLCGAAAEGESGAVMLGRSFGGLSDLESEADMAWQLVQLDMTVLPGRALLSEATVVAGLPAHRLRGVSGSGAERIDVTVVAVATGEDPTVVVGVAAASDPDAMTDVLAALDSLRRA